MDQMSQNETDNQSGSQGIDSIIGTVESYIQDPSLVTPKTLNELKMELMDLKTYLDREESGEPVTQQTGLSDMMSKYGGTK